MARFARWVSALAVAGFIGLAGWAKDEPVNGGRTIFAAPEKTRPLRIAIYRGPGGGEKGVKNVTDRAEQLPGATITRLTGAEFGTRDLSEFDLVVFAGGRGGEQAKEIGPQGRAAVRRFVEAGGGYVGICAGAYLALAGYEDRLGLIDARTVSPRWRRGQGYVELELSEAGRAAFGEVKEKFTIRYANGPVIEPLGRDDLPDYKVLAYFRTELAENDTPAGVMVNSPAVVESTFGRGRVVLLSPHSEDTPGLEHLIPRVILRVARERTLAGATTAP